MYSMVYSMEPTSLALAEQRGLAPTALSQHALEAACGPGLLLSFTNIPEERAAATAQALFDAIGPLPRLISPQRRPA
jgi:hypothetical protein